ncbi:MAG: metallophosphoesterase [SAR324 cluster bacterium]|jgi:DNA repair exonuclease SbcCD nuclease subunit|uniref:Metallophosphoesterase n=1 Tax=SAR324 cluster bacterium TaxID=2024889 RepID=A0A432GJ24_9DELT|nr:MAG: DNA repair exonuclease [Nitrosopumilus sp. YT1]MCH2405494.1 DNA repair exonuclease [Nitrosopumilus sp.]RTZ83728.1 MAG: metallophosphoesterase [SAR324 cluster bacterium]HIO84920.1 DNA repair exonuclease [Candidatus Nitrosopelagicus sp.]|tara:strand:- start:392 stop:1534 length:1143 start_codon:yes stop_codon:yes gene_type:complete
MLFSHISDTHLGLQQYGLEEREQDVYDSFNQAIDISIKDHVDFVIFAGDLFHTPNPSGTAILQMANALKRLKENSIDSFFILGEHDISRMRATPVPYVYHNLEFSKYVGRGKPVYHKDVMIVGFDKIRKSELASFEEKFREIDVLAKQHNGHKILVLHQGITEVNQFAAELNSADLPKSFTYYAMGHLHDKSVKQFDQLGGSLAYPGSTEMTTSEGIKETEKGFFEVDISSKEAKPNWIKLDTRPQFSTKIESKNLDTSISKVLEKISTFDKKPVVEIKIIGKDIERDIVQTKISQIIPQTLHCSWKMLQNEDVSSVLLNRPARIDEELFKLAVNALKSEKLANFAVNDLLPLLSLNQLDQATQLVIENFEQFKEKKNDS